MTNEEKESLNGLLSLLRLFLTEGGIKSNENPFDSYMRLKDYGMSAYSCLDSIIDTYGKEENKIDDKMEKRIEKLERMVTELCVSTQGWGDEADRQVISEVNHRIGLHARKFIKAQILKNEYSRLKEELKILEEDYPELKK